MSDSDDDSDNGGEGGGSGLSLTGFLFGNIDMKTGHLEDDILDEDSKRQLNALSKLGLGSFMNVMQDEQQGGQQQLPVKKKKKKFSSYDSESSSDSDSSSDEDDADISGSNHLNSMRNGGLGSSSSVLPPLPISDKRISADDDYDEDTKSPSAVDFSDINELAEDDLASLNKKQTNDKKDSYDDDYDTDSTDTFVKSTDDKTLMPPPPVPSGVKRDGTSSPKKGESKDADGKVKATTILSPTGSDAKLDGALNTPLAAMMPSKYAGVDVRVLFPDFRPGNVLRFSRLFGKGKATSQPNVWKSVKKRRRKRQMAEKSGDSTEALEDRAVLAAAAATTTTVEPRGDRSWRFEDGIPPPPDSGELTEEERQYYNELNLDLLKVSKSDKHDGSDERMNGLPGHGNIWRHGPAEIWYDMLNIADDEETLDYGFKPKPKATSDEEESSSSSEEESPTKSSQQNGVNEFPVESYHMVTQLDWEADIIWDSSDMKYKKGSKNRSAGWVPSGGNRTAQNFSQTGGKNASGSTASVPGKKDTPVPSTSIGSSGSGGTPTKLSKAAQLKLDAEGGNGPHDDTWYSIFPVENPELVYARWEDDVIWDVEDMDRIPEPKVLALDPNDENIVLCIPDDVDPNAAQGSAPPVKVKIPHPHVKKSKILLGKAGVINVIEEDSPPPSPKNDDKDPYNISNDEYYQPKFTEQSMLKISASGNIIQHSTPVVELRTPFIPTHMGPQKLRNFHRPALRKYSNGPLALPGPHQVLPLTKHIKKKAKQREHERLAAGGGDIFFMRMPEDLTGKDGEMLIIEYCEEHPPLLSQVGMCSKMKNYYKRKPIADNGPPQLKFGETTFAHTSPFLGAMHPGQLIATLENNMYRSPIYIHPGTDSDFLVIRNRNNYFIREMDALFTAGQECPLYEVPGPNSKKANNFVRDFLQVFIYRLFWKSRDSPRRIRMEEIKRAFPMHSESSIRKRLKLCADFKRTGADSNWWVIKPEFRLPTEEEIRAMVSPEQCCAYFSLIAAEQRLKDAGYGEKCLFAPEDDNEDNNQEKMDDEVKTAPWNTTRAYIQAMKGKCLLQLTGPADPTGCGEGFSYVRVPNKPQTNKEEQEAQPKRIVTGTDADLRRLSLNNAKALLRKFGVPEEEIKKLSRWEVIDVVRTLSTEKAKAGEKGMTKFSRGNRFSVAEHQERYKEECQRIFELQNRVLSSSEVLSTDEGESEDEEELSDIEEMGKNIENMLSNKKTSHQLNHEKEEQERRELQKMILGEGTKDEDEKAKDAKKKKKDEEDNSTLSGLANHPGRVLKIHRTFKNADGKEYTRTEIVRKSAIIDVYMKIRTTKDEAFIRQFALLDDQAKEEMKKEKRRIQEQLRRIKRNQEKAANQEKKPPTPRKKKVKMKPDLKMKCGACGQVGHMRTNKACPLYQIQATSPAPPLNVAMTQDEEEEIEKQMFTEDEQLVKVDGTKLQIAGKLIKQAEEVKRRSLVLKVPKDAMGGSGGKLKKKRTSQAEHCDYLIKKNKTANRQRIDPTVAISGIFENIVNEIREIPEAVYFNHPVNPKTVPNYHNIVKNPMDLQTMREKIRNKKYHLRSDFLNDMQLIRDNSSLYNGENSTFTNYAESLFDKCKERVDEQADELDRLERMINPLLDDDQNGLNFLLESCIEKLKSMPESHPFVKPVNKKLVPTYYDFIKNPMDFETMLYKIKSDAYSGGEDFMSDLELMYSNAKLFNGEDSLFARQALNMINSAKEFLSSYKDHLAMLERNIRRTKESNLASPGGYDGDEYESAASENEDGEVQEDGEVEMDMESTYDYDPMSQMGDESRDRRSSVMGRTDEEPEEGEYRSDDDDSRHRDHGKSGQSMDENSQQAVEAMLMMSSFNTPEPSASKSFAPPSRVQRPEYLPVINERRLPLGAETPRNIHDDLAVSDSDNEDEDQPRPNPHRYSHQPQPPSAGDDDGLWF
ncbi:unnamed protein product [Orchesella dallaii]|uniref:Transcription initiation factor TFIID subunit 1 n=1 Tax=Orchesella dallaii TaxID=48710 RepID=A0ABP1PZH0_9HEXA